MQSCYNEWPKCYVDTVGNKRMLCESIRHSYDATICSDYSVRFLPFSSEQDCWSKVSQMFFFVSEMSWCNCRKLTLRGAIQNKSITSIRQIRHLSCFQLCQYSLIVNGDVWCVHNDTITCIRACPQWSNKTLISLIVRKAWEVRNMIS